MLALALVACLTAAPATSATPARNTAAPQLAGLDPALFDRAKLAARRARDQGLASRERLAVIDYRLPSTAKRLWVFDLASGRLLLHEHVAHGKNSGDNVARRFSNEAGSLMTSLGVFVGAEVYQGKHGRSLRLDGLEPGVNDQARARDIVIHAADYAEASFARKHGRLGRSWGCPAVSPAALAPVIDALENGGVLVAFGNDAGWEKRSALLR